MAALNDKYKLVLETIKAYPAQLKQAWDEINEMKLPKEFENVENVVVCGMGGSALGARMIDSLVIDKVKVPIEIINQYHIPFYANGNTLLISSSYSGNTEEALSCLNDALKAKAKIFGITTGGKLAERLKKDKIPGYIFDPRNNPSKQPRMAVGYSVGAILAIFSKLGFIEISEADIEGAIETMREAIVSFDKSRSPKDNFAKTLAKKLEKRAPILVASEHLLGVAHTIKNQFNESAKTFCALFDLPELNHHLMEGLQNPARLKEVLHFVFLFSNLYGERVQARYPLTSEVVEKNGYEFSQFTPKSSKKLNQVFETLVFGSFVGYYLSESYQIDPTAIPWVDYFKKKLSKS